MAVANRRMLPLLLLSGDEDEKKKVLKQSAKESVFSPLEEWAVSIIDVMCDDPKMSNEVALLAA